MTVLRALSLVVLSTLTWASSAAAVIIDDFLLVPLVNPLIAPMGGTVTNFQTGLPTGNVLGGIRLITVTSDFASGNFTTRLLGQPISDPHRFTFTSGMGGNVKFEYDFPIAQDFTLAASTAVPARIRVGVLEMTAGSELTVSLTDGSGSSAAHQSITNDYGSAPTPTYYDYYIDATTFAGSPSPLDFTDIDVATLKLASVDQADDLASFSIEPVSSEPLDWGNSFVLQPAGNQPDLQPIQIGLQSQSGPFATPEVDLSDPTAPKLRLSAQGSMDFRFFIAILYPPDEFLPHRTIDPSGSLVGNQYTFGLIDEESESFQIHVEVDSEAGYPPDEVRWRGFNPQPEPPALYTDHFGFDFSFGDIQARGPALAGPAGDDVTLTIRIQSVSDLSFLSFTRVEQAPGLQASWLAALGLVLAATGAWLGMRRAGA